uniref:Putative bilaris n=1 Tax=Rhipicephalus pulchellus TaxID=72859 RepID=L7LSM0_RHIPC
MALRERLEAEMNCKYFLQLCKFTLFVGHLFIMLLSASSALFSVGATGSRGCKPYTGFPDPKAGDGHSRYCYNDTAKKCVQKEKRRDGHDYRTCFPWPEMCAWYCVSPNVCSLPKQSGDSSCNRAKKLMYYFNEGSQTCELFLYNGCKGNKNRFDEMRRCEVTCKGTPCVTMPRVLPEYCDIPRQERTEMYKYNTFTGSCTKDISCNYEGSNYKTLEDCEQRCLFKKGNLS